MKIILKTISFILGVCIIVILAVASNSEWLDKCDKYIPNPYRYGDLYMLSNMPGYKIKTRSELHTPFTRYNKNTTLTIIGDSYTASFDSCLFNVGNYRFIHWDNTPDTIPQLDTAKKNVLIIECIERYVRWRFTIKKLLTLGKKTLHISHSTIKLSAEDNLQYMLTHLDCVYPFKELKTSIYLNYFDKFSTMVEKPDNSGKLYLNETVDPKNNCSSFNPIDDVEIKNLVDNLNELNSNFLAMGFSEVYISIIPNAASLYKKNNNPYNHLIERIQQNPEAKFKFIDVYAPFKYEKNSVFHCSDSHWNDLGEMIWLLKTTKLLSNGHHTD